MEVWYGYMDVDTENLSKSEFLENSDNCSGFGFNIYYTHLKIAENNCHFYTLELSE
jgi:hypothetical protein